MADVGSSYVLKYKHIERELSIIGWLLRLAAILIVVAYFIRGLRKWISYRRKLLTIPTFNSNPILLGIIVFASVMRNKAIDTNVLFFNTLCGIIYLVRQHGIFRIWMGWRPVVLCYTPEAFEAILRSSSNLNKSFSYNFLSPWLKEGLVTSKGEKWKRRRKMLTPTFHFRILDDFLPIFDAQSRILIQKITKLKEEGDVDITPHVTLCTLDIICESAMGVRLGAQMKPDCIYLSSMHRVCNAFTKRIMRPWLWPDTVYYSNSVGKLFQRDVRSMDEFTSKVIRERKEAISLTSSEKFECNDNGSDPKPRKAFLDLLLEHASETKDLTMADIQEEVDSFMFAGHDTTSAGITWALYLIGLYSDVQEKLLQEIDSVFHGDQERPLLPEDMRNLKYMECVIKECQRLYPSAPFISRDLSEDVVVGGAIIPAGMTCILVMHMLHRDPGSFHNPEVFNPDRFSPENSVGRHPYAYCPFSAGPRSCIGQKYAMLELKAVLCNVLRSFIVTSTQERDTLLLTSEMVTRTTNEMKMKFTTR